MNVPIYVRTVHSQDEGSRMLWVRRCRTTPIEFRPEIICPVLWSHKTGMVIRRLEVANLFRPLRPQVHARRHPACHVFFSATTPAMPLLPVSSSFLPSKSQTCKGKPGMERRGRNHIGKTMSEAANPVPVLSLSHHLLYMGREGVGWENQRQRYV